MSSLRALTRGASGLAAFASKRAAFHTKRAAEPLVWAVSASHARGGACRCAACVSMRPRVGRGLTERGLASNPEKENFGSIYVESSPRSYIERLNPVDYGHYHDRFQELITAELSNFAPKDRQMKAVELGSSYGNTTLTYKCGYNWDAACNAWINESQPLHKAFDFHVTAVDLSTSALAYGRKRGIFDETFEHDFAKPFSPELGKRLEEADLVASIMTSFYIPTERWMEGCYKFLADRSKRKLLVYNVMQAFDQRNLSPELLFAGIPNWTARSSFNKHRNFTELEQRSHNGNKEAWTTTYLVTFHLCEPHKVP